MKKFKLLFLLLTISTYAIAITTPRLDFLEDKNSELASKLEESQKALMQQELNNKNLESKISELKSELEKLKNTQDDYRIEKSSYDFKMQSNTDLVTSQDKRLNDIMLYFTLFLGLFGIGTYLKAKHDAKETAHETAKEFIGKWIDNSATPHLNKKIDDVLETKDDEINKLVEKQIEEKVQPYISKINALSKDIEAHKNKAETEVNEIHKLHIETKAILDTVPKEEIKKIEEKELSSLSSKEHYNLGVDALNDGNLNTALNEFDMSIKLAEKDSIALSDSLFARGVTLSALKKYKEAIEAYQKAVEINPKKDEAYNNMGNAYDEKEEYDKAIEVYQKAVEINPQNDEAYNGMGVAYYWLEKFEDVIKSYIKAININPNNSSAYANLFELQLTQNQPFDQSLETKYIELFQNQKEIFIQYEMLKILQDIVQNQEINLEEWVQKYRGVGLGGWRFDELCEWIGGVEDEEVKARLQEALAVFEGHGKK